MYTKRLLIGMIMLVYIILATSCSVSDVLGGSDPPADPPIRVTPYDTSAPTLIVTVNINEDQDITNHLTTITFSFRTHVIEENNYVRFDKGQYVTCNVDDFLALNTLQQYPLKVSPQAHDLQGYSCFYFGSTEGIGLLPPVLMFDVKTRSELDPQQPHVDGGAYQIGYTPDSNDSACPITADAIDSAHHDIPGSPSSSDKGTYVGPYTSMLRGAGDIILRRICVWNLSQPFYALHLTYQSTASIEVTWAS